MSIYSDALTALQRVGLHGGDLTHAEKRNLLAVVRARAAETTAVTTADAAVEVQCLLLDAEGGASAVIADDIRALMVTLVAAVPVDTLVVNTIIDG